jgi:hypothetical protein
MHYDFKETKDGVRYIQSAAPSKLDDISIAADANDEARLHVPTSTAAPSASGMSAPGMSNEAGNHKIHPHPHSCEFPQAKASLNNATTTATPQHIMPTTTSDAEIAMACAEIEITKETEAKEKIRDNVKWKAPKMLTSLLKHRTNGKHTNNT